AARAPGGLRGAGAGGRTPGAFTMGAGGSQTSGMGCANGFWVSPPHPGGGGARRTRRPSPTRTSSEFHAGCFPRLVSGNFVLKCDRSHLQIAHQSFTLVPARSIPLAERVL